MTCEQWLKERLGLLNPVNCDVIRNEAVKLGFKKKDLSLAKRKLGVATFDDSVLHDGVAQNWFWVIPKGTEE